MPRLAAAGDKCYVSVGSLPKVLGAVYLLLVSPILDLYSQREAMLTDRRMLAPRLSAARRSPPKIRLVFG
jgi:hypothetical protein